MSLPTRPLGRTGIDITTVGLGAWAIGGADGSGAWGPQDDADSIAAIHAALERGVNWIDTAAAYGHGHSEEVVARALRDVPEADRPFVFTKCGYVWNDDDQEELESLAVDSIRSECEASLRRLDVERIDLYQFHTPSRDGTPIEESWAVMLELIEEGKVRAGGVSNFDVTLLERSEAVGHVATLQPPFSLIDRAAAADVIPWAREHETGVIVYSPMQSGLLTGRFTRERAESLPEGDWRATDANFTGPRLARNLLLQEALRPMAERHSVTPGAVAIAWTLAWPGVSGAIVGARSAEQVDGWIGAADLDLTAKDLADLQSAIQVTGAGTGPSIPA